MEQFSTYFGLRLSHHLFAPAEITSRGAAKGRYKFTRRKACALSSTKTSRGRMCSRTCNHKLWQKRRTKLENQDWQDTERSPDAFLMWILQDMKTPKTCTNEFLSAVELLERELEKQSEQPSFSVTSAVEDILVSSAMGQTAERPELVADMYGNDLNFEELTQQLKIAAKIH